MICLSLAALGPSRGIWALSSCGAWGLSSSWGVRLLTVMASLVEHRLPSVGSVGMGTGLIVPCCVGSSHTRD